MIVMRLPWLSVLGSVLAAVAVVSAVMYSPLAPAADSFTAGVLSCAAEGDRDRRLDCYDRAVASFTARLSDGKRESGTAPTPLIGNGAARAGPATASAPALPAATLAPAAPAATSVAAADAGRSAPSVARHVAARIVSIDHFPDYVVVHLDNQQIWKQVSDSPGGPALRTGDPVTIDKEMGSYWLSAAKGEAVQVKLQAPKP
jgi:hypothetical protein